MTSDIRFKLLQENFQKQQAQKAEDKEDKKNPLATCSERVQEGSGKFSINKATNNIFGDGFKVGGTKQGDNLPIGQKEEASVEEQCLNPEIDDQKAYQNMYGNMGLELNSSNSQENNNATNPLKVGGASKTTSVGGASGNTSNDKGVVNSDKGNQSTTPNNSSGPTLSSVVEDRAKESYVAKQNNTQDSTEGTSGSKSESKAPDSSFSWKELGNTVFQSVISGVLKGTTTQQTSSSNGPKTTDSVECSDEIKNDSDVCNARGEAEAAEGATKQAAAAETKAQGDVTQKEAEVQEAEARFQKASSKCGNKDVIKEKNAEVSKCEAEVNTHTQEMNKQNQLYKSESAKVKTANAKVAETDIKIGTKKTEIGATKAEISNLEAQASTATKENKASIESQIARAKSKLAQQESELKQLETEKANAEREGQAAQQAADNAFSAQEGASQKLSEAQIKLEQAKEELNNAIKEGKEGLSEEDKKELENAKKDLEAKRAELTTAKGNLGTAQGNHQSAKNTQIQKVDSYGNVVKTAQDNFDKNKEHKKDGYGDYKSRTEIEPNNDARKKELEKKAETNPQSLTQSEKKECEKYGIKIKNNVEG